MRKELPRNLISRNRYAEVVCGLIAGCLMGCLLLGGITPPSLAASHREAPMLLNDPMADSTDFFAFRSYERGREKFITMIVDYIPGELPPAGPHWYKFDDTALYEFNVDNTGDGVPDLKYQFDFETRIVNPDTVLGMASPTETLTGKQSGVDRLISSLDDPDYNERQTYTVTRVDSGGKKVLATGLVVPPANIGKRTTPDYESLARQAVYSLKDDIRVFAGPRDDPFFIALGPIFDTLNLPTVERTGAADYLAGLNVHSIAIEVPIQALTRDGMMPDNATDANAVIGTWATASRLATSVMRSKGKDMGGEGAWRQVSRLGNPLVNELVIPLKLKDAFCGLVPKDDAVAAEFVLDPQLAKLMKAVFGIDIPPAPRHDLVAIFATGIKAGAIPNYTTFLSDGKPHEMLRLNVAIPPTPSDKQNDLGLLGGDLAGFPNGRRVGDDVTDIALRAVAGGTPFTPDTNKAPNNTLGDGVDRNDVPYLPEFPYLGLPHSGRK